MFWFTRISMPADSITSLNPYLIPILKKTMAINYDKYQYYS
jgi:hypothetical protein